MARKIRLSSICPLLLLAVFVYVLRSLFSMNLWSRLSMFTASDLLSLILCPWFTASDYVAELKSMNGLKEDVIHSGQHLTIMYCVPVTEVLAEK